MRKVRILRNLTFLKILSAIFYKSKVSKKEQAMRGLFLLENEREQVKRTNYIEKMIKKLIFKQKMIHIHLYMADHL